MSDVGFLKAQCWLDEDGEHVWMRHYCLLGFETTMLPWPTWRAEGGRVWPSVNCELCGLHFFAEIGAAP